MSKKEKNEELAQSAFDDDKKIIADLNQTEGEVDSFYTHALILIPGIRDWGGWSGKINDALHSNPHIHVILIRPDNFFDILKFILPIFHKKPEQWVAKRINTVLEKNYQEVSFIAHSFGGHCLSRFLQDCEQEIDRVIFCGTIIKDNFDWDNCSCVAPNPLKSNVKIINDCGNKDIYPLLAKWLNPIKFGSSGRSGSSHPKVKDRYHNIGHGDFFSESFIETYLLPFILENKIIKGKESSNSISWLLSLLTIEYLSLPVLIILTVIITNIIS